MSGTWYVTNNPSTQDMTKGTLADRSFINQVKYSPKWSSQAIAGTNDGNVWIGFNLGTGAASQANWVNVTGEQRGPAEPAGARGLARSSTADGDLASATRLLAASTRTRRRRQATSSR